MWGARVYLVCTWNLHQRARDDEEDTVNDDPHTEQDVESVLTEEEAADCRRFFLCRCGLWWCGLRFCVASGLRGLGCGTDEEHCGVKAG